KNHQVLEANVKTIVYVEKEKFLRDVMERALHSAGVRIYTYPDQDCLHFIADLQPDVLMVDVATVDDAFFMQINTQIPLVLTGTPAQLELCSRPARARIEKPLGPFEVVSQIM